MLSRVHFFVWGLTKVGPQKVPSEKAEMAVQEDSTELTADKDFELVVAEALKKVDPNLSA